MQLENETVIDIDAEQIDSAECESIDVLWYSAAQMQRILGLKNKSALQKAISKLTSIYAINIKILRRGGARATKYSHVALKAIKLLNDGKFSELRKLVEETPTAAPVVASSAAIVFVEQHNQIATNAATVADNNLTQIASFKSGLLDNYRELGRALGKQASAEMRLGFTEEVKAGFSDLQEA